MKMRTTTCFGNQTSRTFLIIPSVSLAKITQSHGPITLWLWMFSTVLYLFVLPEIKTLQEKKNYYIKLSQSLPPIPPVQCRPSWVTAHAQFYQVTFMAPEYHFLDAPWSLGRKSVFCTFLCVLYRVCNARSAFYTWVHILYPVRNA